MSNPTLIISQQTWLQKDFKRLNKYVQHLASTTDIFCFLNLLNHTIGLLQNVSQRFRETRNSYGKIFPSTLICYSFCFLPFSYVYSNRSVCKLWNQALSSTSSIGILFANAKIPTGAFYNPASSWNMKFVPSLIAFGREKMYVGMENLHTYTPTMKIQVFNLAGVDLGILNGLGDTSVSHFAVTNEYLCISGLEWRGEPKRIIQLFTHENQLQLISKWTVPQSHALVMDQKHIYLLDSTFCWIYSYAGDLLRRWQYHHHSLTCESKIAVNNQKVFISDPVNCNIAVFSSEGKRLTQWGKKGNSDGEFKLIETIAVSDDVVYIIDSGKNLIQAFTHTGVFLFKVRHGRAEGLLMRICVLQDKLYITNSQNNLLVFQLEYDYKKLPPRYTKAQKIKLIPSLEFLFVNHSQSEENKSK